MCCAKVCDCLFDCFFAFWHYIYIPFLTLFFAAVSYITYLFFLPDCSHLHCLLFAASCWCHLLALIPFLLSQFASFCGSTFEHSLCRVGQFVSRCFFFPSPLFFCSFHTSGIFSFYNGFTPICNCLFSFFFTVLCIVAFWNAMHMYMLPQTPLISTLYRQTILFDHLNNPCALPVVLSPWPWVLKRVFRDYLALFFSCFSFAPCPYIHSHPSAPTITHMYPYLIIFA